MYMKNWICRGLSNPYSSRIRWMISGVARGPAMSWAASPGTTWEMRNVMSRTPKRVGINSNNLRATKDVRFIGNGRGLPGPRPDNPYLSM